MARKIGELFYELRASSESLSKDLKEGERQFGKFAAFIKANPVAAAGGLVVAFAGVAFAASKAAGEIEREMRQVNALLGLSGEGAAAVQDDMVELAAAAGESQANISRLFRTIAENGPGSAANVRSIADAAIALSQVLGGDLGANAQGIDSVTDLFGIDPSRAREIAAALFEISKGRVPLGDLLQVISKVGPDVVALGIDFETTAALITRFLDAGFSTKRVASTIKELAENGAEGRAEMIRLAGAGVDLTAAMNSLNDAQNKAQNSAEALSNRIKNQLNAVWLEFGNTTLKVVAVNLALVAGYFEQTGNAATRMMNAAIRAKAALDSLNATPVAQPRSLNPGDYLGARPLDLPRPTSGPVQPQNDPGPLFQPIGQSYGEAQRKAEKEREIERIGEQIAKLKTETNKLELLSVAQLRDVDRRLLALKAVAGNDSQLAKIEELRKEIGDRLPFALKTLSDQTKRAEKELSSLLAKADALNTEFNGQSDAERGAGRIAAWAKEAKDAGVPAEAIRLEVEALNAAFTRFNARKAESEMKDFAKALDERTAALEESLKKQADLIALEKREADQRDATLADLRGEIAVRQEGANATEAYLKQRARNLIIEQQVEAARARAKRADREATDEEIAGARNYGNQLADTKEQLETLSNVAENSLLRVFADVATQATSIATSLGESGENLARMAAIVGPLFTGLSGISGALQGRDSKGQVVAGTSVSFLNALKGGNGAESQAQALAGAVTILGAVAGIADALDLFGTHAKEEARKMKEAAREFAKSLEDFVAQANPKSGASEAIANARRRAEELGKQAAAAGGGTTTFDGEVTAEVLRARAKELNAAADAAEKSTPKLASALRTVADGFNDVADGLVAVEAAARAQVRENLKDLEVRTLQAAGLTEAAANRRREIDAERELTAARQDASDVGLEYLAALEGVIVAERLAAEAAAYRAGILRELDDTLAVLGGTAGEQLLVTIDRLGQAFPELAGVFDGFDLSTREGLEAARDKLRDIYRELSADGISDAEQPLVDAIRRILGGIEGAFGALPSIDPIASALEAFAVRVEVFGLSAKDQLTGLIEIFGGAFDELDTLLSGADPNSTGGLQAFASSLQEQINAILEGGIDDEERPRLEALRRLLAAVTGTLDEIASQAERDRLALVNGNRSNTSNTIAINGLTGFAALDTRVNGLAQLSPALAALLPLFSDRSVDGIATTQDALRALFRQIQDGSIDVSQFGALTKEELIEAIIALNGELGGLSDSLLDAAQAAAQAAAAEREATADLRIRNAKAFGEDTRLAEFDDRARREREQAVAEGRSASYLAFLDQVLANERRKLLSDIANESAAAAVTASNEVAKQGAVNTEITRNVGSITEVSAQTMVSILRQIESNTRTVASYFAGGLPAPPVSFGGGGGGRGNGGNTYIFQLAAPTVPISNRSAAAAIGAEYGRAASNSIAEALGKLVALDMRYQGGSAL